MTIHSDNSGQFIEMTDILVNGHIASSTGRTVVDPKLEFRNIKYTIQLRTKCCSRQHEKKDILHGIHGEMQAGLNAIIGPTGSGKTTLLDVLAKRKNPACVEGEVTLNGHQIPDRTVDVIGYVTQNDLFVGTMTVRETLWFCANTRMPKCRSRQYKAEKIDRVIRDLALQDCIDTKVGSAFARGISGGEKKRTSIAVEMLLDPDILFLDEPTTGLDAATAISVMRHLKNLGNNKRIVVCSIHQPRYSIFKLFDSLTVLSMGHCVYNGLASHVVQHFGNLNYSCPLHDNPADFILDVLIGEHKLGYDSEGDGVNNEELRSKITEKLLSSSHDQPFSNVASAHQTYSLGNSYATGTSEQLKFLLLRTLNNIVRNPRALIGTIIQYIVIGTVFGLLYFRVYENPQSAPQNILGILFFICTSMIFGSYSVINAFSADLEIFIHEHVSGYYRVISYFLAKVLADLIPLRTVGPIFFGIITYWMVGLKPDVSSFFTFLLTSLLLGYASVGIGLFYSASMQPAVATICLSLTFVFTLIFSGLLVRIDDMVIWLSWLKYLSVARYGLVALSVNEFSGRIFHICANATRRTTSVFTANTISTAGVSDSNISCITRGEDILFETLSVGDDPDNIGTWHLWSNNVALGCFCVALYTLTYIQLLRKPKYS